jgi:hypothetical protein
VTARLIHDASREGVTIPPTLVSLSNYSSTDSESNRLVTARLFDALARAYYCSGLALTTVEC